jgi:hypothetical protein
LPEDHFAAIHPDALLEAFKELAGVDKRYNCDGDYGQPKPMEQEQEAEREDDVLPEVAQRGPPKWLDWFRRRRDGGSNGAQSGSGQLVGGGSVGEGVQTEEKPEEEQEQQQQQNKEKELVGAKSKIETEDTCVA